MKNHVIIFIISIFSVVLCSCSVPQTEPALNLAPGLKVIDEYTLAGEKNFLTDFEPLNSDSTVNIVVEIPCGTNEKWEVKKPEGTIKWDFKNGKPRIVSYLGYPGNYGMIPQTLLSKELGGDGDPLDVIALGPAALRGSVVKAKMIGVLKLLDGGEQDDKIIAVLAGGPFEKVVNLADLDRKFPGVTTILEIWFTNYKGPGEMESHGFNDIKEARTIFDAARNAFAASQNKQAAGVMDIQ